MTPVKQSATAERRTTGYMKLKWNALMRRHEMLLQFLLPYLCMMLLFVPLTIFTTNRLLNTVTQHTADILYQELERTSDLFDRQFSELKDLSYTLAKDPAVVAVGNLPPPEELAPADYIDLMVLEEDIVRYYQSSDYIDGLSLWFGQSQIARIGNTFLTADHPSYLTQYTFNGQSYADFFSAFYRSGQMDALVQVDIQLHNSLHEDMLLYCVNLDILSGGNGEICAFYQLNLSSLDRLFQFFVEKYASSIRLCSAAGETLYSIGSDAPFDSLTDHTESPDGYLSLNTSRTLFTCQLLSPSSQITREAGRMRWSLVTISSATILLSIALSLFYSHRFASPLQKTVDALGKNEIAKPARRRSLDNLYRSVEKLITSEQQLVQQLETERDMRKMGLLGSILFQTAPMPEDFLRRESEALDIDLSYPFYTAVYCRASAAPVSYSDDDGENRLAQQTIISQALSQTLSSCLPDIIYLYKHQEESYILVTGLQDVDRDSLAEALEEAAGYLKSAFGISLCCCIGMPVPSIAMIAEPFQAAQFILEHTAGPRTVQLAEKKDYPHRWEFSAEIETSLIQSCLAGNEQQTGQLIDRIFDSITDFSPSNLHQMIFSFRGTILRILSNFSGQNMAPAMAQSQHLTSCKTFDELHQVTKRILRSICLLIHNEKSAKQEDLYRQVLDYITRYYADPELTLTRVADHFHLNEKYLSHFFKETGGSNFSAMVEKVRMDKIIEYMRETNLPISDICIRCGYSSSNSFYKAFKRIYGVSPNAYRQQLS